jgi:hypothetical protein
MTGVMGLLGLLFRLLAKRARSEGVDKYLESKYCR